MAICEPNAKKLYTKCTEQILNSSKLDGKKFLITRPKCERDKDFTPFEIFLRQEV